MHKSELIEKENLNAKAITEYIKTLGPVSQGKREFRTILSTRVSQKFCNILVHISLWCIYNMTEAVPSIVDSIAVVGALTCCALLHSVINS